MYVGLRVLSLFDKIRNSLPSQIKKDTNVSKTRYTMVHSKTTGSDSSRCPLTEGKGNQITAFGFCSVLENMFQTSLFILRVG